MSRMKKVLFFAGIALIIMLAGCNLNQMAERIDDNESSIQGQWHRRS